MENYSGYQRQLIITRIARVEKCLTVEMEAEAESDEIVPADYIPDEIRRLVIEFERLVTVALLRGFTLGDIGDLYGLTDYDQYVILRDRIGEASVEAAIKTREDCLFDALAALVPETISIGQGE